jgi:hypothetical protein
MELPSGCVAWNINAMEVPLNEGEQLTLLRIERARLLASIQHNSEQCVKICERALERSALVLEGTQGPETSGQL